MFAKTWQSHQPKTFRVFPAIICTSIVLGVAWFFFSIYYYHSPPSSSQTKNNFVRAENNYGSIRTEPSIQIPVKLDNGSPDGTANIRHNDVPVVENDRSRQAHSTATTKPTVNKEDSDFHIIFSTGCSPFQDWQSLLVFYSAMDVGQKDPITRIASGCSPEDEDRLTDIHKKLPKQFRIHFTPDFSVDPITGREYYFYNKPFGLLHFLDHVPLPADVVLALIDPDMIFLRPLTHIIKDDVILFSSPVGQSDIIDKVTLGHPAAQYYMIGSKWLQFNISTASVSDGEAWKYYSVGPPYIAHNNDFKRIATSWVEAVPKVFAQYPYLLAEMYAYSIAAANNHLPHTRLHHYMISNIDVGHGGEAWQYIDGLDYPDVCPVLASESIQAYFKSHNYDMPVFLHYCQFYRAEEWAFHKRHLNDDFFSCNSPLLAPPPSNLSYSTQKIKVKEKKTEKFTKDFHGKRNAFMICTITRALNQAAIRYKETFCGPGANFEMSLRVD